MPKRISQRHRKQIDALSAALEKETDADTRLDLALRIAQVVCLAGLQCSDTVSSELHALSWLEGICPAGLGHDLVCRVFLLAKSVLRKKPVAELESLAMASFEPSKPIVILAGGCGSDFEAEAKSYRRTLTPAFEDFEGILVSGGTTAGISGLAGFLAGNTARKGTRKFELVGYLPRRKPKGVRKDSRYDRFVITSSEDFSALEPLQMWTDIVVSGIHPKQVKLLGIGGGKVAAFEYRLALALGAEVGIVRDSGREASELLGDADWQEVPNLLPLPRDRMTLRAFVNPQRAGLSGRALEKIAKTIHAEYLRNNKHKAPDPSLLPWKELAENLKDSNRKQAAYAREILLKAGYDTRTVPKKSIELIDFSSAETELMAEMEHGRWNVERIRSGWRPGPRHPERKINPYLIPWEELPDDIKEYDRDAIRSFPKALKEAGLEVYRMRGHRR